MKIAILCPNFFTFSGIDRVAEQQAKRFAEEGNDVSLFTLKANMDSPQGVRLQILGMPDNFLIQRVYRLLFPLDFIKAIRWVPKLKDFDFIYSHQYPMNWLAYLAKRFYGVKYVYYNHGYPSPDKFSNFVEHIYMRVITILANWTIKRADGAISISRYLQQELKRKTNLDSEVIYNKIDAQRFRTGIDGSVIRRQYNLTGNPIILFVGRISPTKGVHLLIQAFNLVREKVPSANLLIVGEHPYSDYSKELKRMSDNSVIFTGDVTDEELPYYYAACDVFATAALWEGFNLPLAEAQSCGKPVVAFDIGPHPEVVKDVKMGKLVPTGDTKAMAEAIVGLIKAQSGRKA